MKPTQEQVIQWAHEAGLHIATDVHWMPIIGLEYLEKATAFAYEAGRKDENEACIKTLEDFSQTRMVPVKDTWRMGLIAGAHALRRRGENND